MHIFLPDCTEKDDELGGCSIKDRIYFTSCEYNCTHRALIAHLVNILNSMDKAHHVKNIHENVSMPEQFNNVLLKLQFCFTQCPRILVNSHFGQVVKIHWQNANPPNICLLIQCMWNPQLNNKPSLKMVVL